MEFGSSSLVVGCGGLCYCSDFGEIVGGLDGVSSCDVESFCEVVVPAEIASPSCGGHLVDYGVDHQVISGESCSDHPVVDSEIGLHSLVFVVDLVVAFLAHAYEVL